MRDCNPYQTPDDSVQHAPVIVKPRSKARWALIGFALGAALPVAYGVYGMQQHYAYIVSLAPGEAACGMGAIGPLAMMFVIGPFCGMIGAASGWAAAAIDWGSAL